MADYAALVATLERCAARAEHETLTLGEVLDSMEDASFGLICIVLCLPFLQPISLGPLATLGGLTFAALGLEYFMGRLTPALPRRVRAAALGPKGWRILLKVCVRIVTWARLITRPRLRGWVTGRAGHHAVGGTICVAGLLMAIPFFGLPFNNALPAAAILCACIALIEEDGVMLIIAYGWLVVTVAYFSLVVYLLWTVGLEAVRAMFPV